MPSYQSSAGAGKSQKFVSADPLRPMADPFAGVDDDSKEYHKVLAENVNSRLTKAMGDIKERHSSKRGDGGGGENNGPTGPTYRHQQQMQQQQQQLLMIQQQQQQQQQLQQQQQQQQEEQYRNATNSNPYNDDDEDDENSVVSSSSSSSSEDDDDDEYDELLDDIDPELEKCRRKRLIQLHKEHDHIAQLKSLGHGEYRHITQDEFLKECGVGIDKDGTQKQQSTNDNDNSDDEDEEGRGTENNNKDHPSCVVVVVHFYHDDYKRCDIFHHHLSQIASRHVETKFVKVDATKTPFFVHKLQVRTLPTLVVFRGGIVIGRLVGFDGLAFDENKPDEFSTQRLVEWLSNIGAVRYRKPNEEMLDEMKRFRLQDNNVGMKKSTVDYWDDDE